jgi:PKD repeat protein
MGSPQTGMAPLTVQFTSICTGTITAYSWTLGDGGTSTEQNPVYAYKKPGTYGVALQVTDANGNTKTAAKPEYIKVTRCPVQNALDNQGDVLALRMLRESLLKNISGMMAVAIYYRNAEEIYILFEEYPEMQEQLNNMVIENRAIVQDIISGRETAIPSKVMGEVLGLLNEIKEHASPRLQSDLDVVRTDIRDGWLLNASRLIVER